MAETIPRLFFKCSEIDDFDSEMKGYRNDAFVIMPDSNIYEVFFYDNIRLEQDKGTGGFIAQPGLIIFPAFVGVLRLFRLCWCLCSGFCAMLTNNCLGE